MNILKLLDELEEIVDTAPDVPILHRIKVNPEEILAVIADIRAELPKEIPQAEQITEGRTSIIKAAENQAEAIVRQAKHEAEEYLKEVAIREKAIERGKAILADAQKEALNIKADALKEIDAALSV